MSSNLKVNTILPSTGTAIGIGTASGNVDVLGHIVGHNTPNISGINSVTATTFYGSGANLTGITTTTIHNNANKRVIVGTSTANTLEADSGVFIGPTGKLSIGNVVATSQISNYSLDIKGDGTNAYIDLGDPFPSFSAGQFPTARLKTVDANKTLELQSMYGGDNVLYKHIELSGNNTIFYRGDNVNTEIGRWTLNGLTFNGDTATANALDDYEEGVYQPTMTGSSSGSHTLTTYTHIGYTKIGRLVHIQGYININGGSLSGNLKLSLPFTVSNDATGHSRYSAIGLSWRGHGWSGNTGEITFAPQPNTTYGEFVSVSPNGSHIWVNNTHVNNSYNIRIGGCYITNT